jgi:hypothetical protein
MVKRYFIIVKMRVAEGYMETGNFFIGEDKELSSELFKQLAGNCNHVDAAMIQLCLVEFSEEGMQTVMNTFGCTLDEVTESTKIIMKETFKLLNLSV